jgi:hypothetical protein
VTPMIANKGVTVCVKQSMAISLLLSCTPCRSHALRAHIDCIDPFTPSQNPQMPHADRLRHAMPWHGIRNACTQQTSSNVCHAARFLQASHPDIQDQVVAELREAGLATKDGKGMPCQRLILTVSGTKPVALPLCRMSCGMHCCSSCKTSSSTPKNGHIERYRSIPQ